MDEFLAREMIPSPPTGEVVTKRYIVEVTSRFSDTHSAIAAHLMGANGSEPRKPNPDWPFYGTVYSEDGSRAVSFPIVCCEGGSEDPDDACNAGPWACDPVGNGCAAPKPVEARYRIVEID